MGRTLSIKVFEDVVVHCFDVMPGHIAYIVSKRPYEPVCQGDADLLDRQDDEYGHVRSLRIRTQLYDFEIIRSESWRYLAYRSSRRKNH